MRKNKFLSLTVFLLGALLVACSGGGGGGGGGDGAGSGATTTPTTSAHTTTTTTSTIASTTTTTLPVNTGPDSIKEADAERNAWEWMSALTYFYNFQPEPFTDIQHVFGSFDWVFDPDANLFLSGFNDGELHVTNCDIGGTLTQSGMVNETNPLEFSLEERYENCQYFDVDTGTTIIINGVVKASNLLPSPDPISSFYHLNYSYSQTGLTEGQPYREEEKDGDTLVFYWEADLSMVGTYRAKDTNVAFIFDRNDNIESLGSGEIQYDLTLDGHEDLNGTSFVYSSLNDSGFYKWGDRFTRDQEELDNTLNGRFLYAPPGLAEDMIFTNFHNNDNVYYARNLSKWYWSYTLDGRFQYTGSFSCPDLNGTFDFDTSLSGSPITRDFDNYSPGIPWEPVSGRELIKEVQGGIPGTNVTLQVNGLNSVQASSVDEDWVNYYSSWGDIYTACP